MRTSLAAALAGGRVLVADGAMGSNLVGAGLDPAALDLADVERPDLVLALHAAYVAAGADVILTNTFGANRYRLAPAGHADRVREIARRGAELARRAADAAPRPVVVAGSMGPTGRRVAPHGALAFDDAVAAFREQAEALRDGGADVAWIETMSAATEARAAARAAIDAGLPYVVTYTYGADGRTPAGEAPAALVEALGDLDAAPLAVGANCGVGAAGVVAAVAELCALHPRLVVVAKASAGLPDVRAGVAVYPTTGAPVAEYARLAVDAGARVVGGCCGTTPAHVAAVRAALDAHVAGERPTAAVIAARLGAPPRRS